MSSGDSANGSGHIVLSSGTSECSGNDVKVITGKSAGDFGGAILIAAGKTSEDELGGDSQIVGGVGGGWSHTTQASTHTARSGRAVNLCDRQIYEGKHLQRKVTD